MRLHWIWFTHRPGLTDRAKISLLEHFRDPEDIYYADGSAYDIVEGLSLEARKSLRDKDLGSAEKILRICDRERIQVLTFQDAAYPVRLKNIPDPPMVLYYRGQLPEFDVNPVIGVVGTRQASAYGLTTAKGMGAQIARCGGIVVSGMAQGIDTMAMRGALSADGTVVGVLGCGVDVVYPPSNRGLYRDLVNYGCVLSEFSPGTQPAKWTFPRRNRIISGLSVGVLVVEAPEGSGSLITADRAAEQGRDVFVVPGNIDQPGFVGSNRLLRDGATVAVSGWDIMQGYAGRYPDKIHHNQTVPRQSPSPEEVPAQEEKPENSGKKTVKNTPLPHKRQKLKKELDKKGIDKGPSTAYSDVNEDKPKPSTPEQAILAALAEGERLTDDVLAETGLPAGRFLAALTMLEIRGAIQRLPGKRVRLTR